MQHYIRESTSNAGNRRAARPWLVDLRRPGGRARGGRSRGGGDHESDVDPETHHRRSIRLDGYIYASFQGILCDAVHAGQAAPVRRCGQRRNTVERRRRDGDGSLGKCDAHVPRRGRGRRCRHAEPHPLDRVVARPRCVPRCCRGNPRWLPHSAVLPRWRCFGAG